MKDINSIEIDRSMYETKDEYENAVKTAIMLLLDAGYIMTVEYEDCDFVVIKYSYSDEEIGDKMPRWISPDEWELILSSRKGGDTIS